ncbi:MAG TPA: hypothetical protein ACFYEF_00150 [Candidatus Wunengus sp. YC63]|uniref:hypothetical protein n=1 Tax=Candidatus Wunengus sp. YC63 TaxID=3367699 RepID=UPI0040271AF4
MDYQELLKLFLHPKRNLPYVEANDSKSFLFHYREKMSDYINDLKELDEDCFGDVMKDTFIERVEGVIKQIDKTLRYYFKGDPPRAFRNFKRLIKKEDLKIELVYGRTIRLERNFKFYRTKKEYDKNKLSNLIAGNGFTSNLASIDLFHVPFQNRRAIGTNRFSIPGYPCLYLSDSLKTSWSECFEDIEEFHASSFRNHRPIYVIDLVPLDYIVKQNGGALPDEMYLQTDTQKILNDYAVMYPIIFACHSKIKYAEAYKGEKILFKSEYVIPQLLLQWCKAKNILIDGIRYLSCTAETRFPTESFDKFNYIVPAINSLEEGYCNNLMISFSATPVYSYIEKDGKDVDTILSEIKMGLDTAIYDTLKPKTV